MYSDFPKVLKDFECLKKDLSSVISATREMILSNLSMISQIPAFTFEEKKRSEFILEKFAEAGIPDPSTDIMYNALGKIENSKTAKTILITAHMDNPFDEAIDQNISIRENKVFGMDMAEDNLALAALTTLPDILARSKMQIKSNLSLLATTRSHGKGDFEGMRYYLNNLDKKPDCVIHLSGITFGKIDYFTLSRVRCDIKSKFNIPSEMAWVRSTHDSAIVVINEVINAILSIPLPRQPKSVINLGMINGGERYSTVSREASINIEFLSEKDNITDSVITQINDYCMDIGARHGVEVRANFFGRHHAAGINCSHPLIKVSIEIIKSLGFEPIIEYSCSEITVPLSMGIPTVSIGVATGTGGKTPEAYINTETIEKGILQLLALIYMIDNGCCSE
ncbi:MAG: Peptidase dimerization domain protein [Candidatus Uhrbacteria bacterium GW2011_GWF2_39_13]|uniref:Peptidase dimerization domain protein n=1 Tax=Candidatus Uhrbacteria bacterium GW2011_GWF2_39_13 TaxID=1618995 RepID=A0A0G0MT78_9BACT|nr:MAG: Peptidase dimerization domain protein [Candidatus Uhrbacteria bacterium GW2011_GWF2_39_13]